MNETYLWLFIEQVYSRPTCQRTIMSSLVVLRTMHIYSYQLDVIFNDSIPKLYKGRLFLSGHTTVGQVFAHSDKLKIKPS